MVTLPEEIVTIVAQFAPVFSRCVWEQAQVLLIGAILAPGQRTVTAILRVMGLAQEQHFQTYHRVLNRACWASLALSQMLLRLLLAAFVAEDAAVVLGMDETIERRRGAKIAAKGIYRDPVRSSQSHFVKTSGLRWVSMMLLAPIPWAKRVWALPFLTVLATSERYAEQRGQTHKKLTDWGRRMMLQVRRWLPERRLVVVADSSYAVIELLAWCGQLKNPVTMITRLRLDAALYDPAPPRKAGTKGRPRQKGERQPSLQKRLQAKQTVWETLQMTWYGRVLRTLDVATGTAVWYHAGMTPAPIRWVLICDPKHRFEPQALLCTDLTTTPAQIVAWFILRWQLEVTFHEVRTHLGVETQRQWSDLAILRTTPALLALFSLVTLFAQVLLNDQPMPVRQAAWYHKTTPTFTDTLAFVRQHFWSAALSSMSGLEHHIVKIPLPFFQRLSDTVAFAI